MANHPAPHTPCAMGDLHHTDPATHAVDAWVRDLDGTQLRRWHICPDPACHREAHIHAAAVGHDVEVHELRPGRHRATDPRGALAAQADVFRTVIPGCTDPERRDVLVEHLDRTTEHLAGVEAVA